MADRTTFEVATRADFPGRGFDLVATFDCLHDMGDPVGAARHIREALAPDGTWMIVEPLRGRHASADNLNPVGRAYYGFSTFLCVPNALSQEAGTRWARRPARPPSGRSSPRPGSPGSAAPPRRRSTTSSRPGPDQHLSSAPSHRSRGSRRMRGRGVN